MEPILSEIRLFAFGWAPEGWALCNGQFLPIVQNQALFVLIGTTFGGDGRSTFRLPDLRGRALMASGKNFVLGIGGGEAGHALTTKEMAPHKHTAIASSVAADVNSPENAFWSPDTNYRTDQNIKLAAGVVGITGNGQPHDNMAPYLALSYCICIKGESPPVYENEDDFVGNVRVLTNGKAGDSWLPCDGRELNISSYVSLFTVIRNRFGGDGTRTFRLPDLRTRAVIGCGQGDGLSHYDQGETGGAETVGLTAGQLPAHNHTPTAAKRGTAVNPSNTNTWASHENRPPTPFYSKQQGTAPVLNPGAIETEGEGAPHNNLMPYQVLSFYIAHKGEMPINS